MLHNISLEELQDCLMDLEFPATKREILDMAEKNAASPDMIENLRRIPSGSYEDFNAVRSALDDLG